VRGRAWSAPLKSHRQEEKISPLKTRQSAVPAAASMRCTFAKGAFVEYEAFEKGIEVNGQTVWAIVDGFRAFSMMASEFLLAEKIGEKGQNGVAVVRPDAWYSQEAWLRVFKKIGTSVGEAVLFQIGLSIPRNAKFPPWVIDVHSAVKSIDIAYHMNHRKQGKEMFDPADGTMLEGIGHYGYEGAADGRHIISVCKNPYPCSFDRGIITTMAQKFAPIAQVVHDDSKPCRRKGADNCTYIVTW
jgi:hypothetical protein